MSWSVALNSSVYETTKLPLASIATSGSNSLLALLATAIRPPTLAPLLLNRFAKMSVWPLLTSPDR